MIFSPGLKLDFYPHHHDRYLLLALRVIDVEDVSPLCGNHVEKFGKRPGPVIEQHGEPEDPPLSCHGLPDNPEELGGIDIPAADHQHNSTPQRDGDRAVQESRERGSAGTFGHHMLALEQQQHRVGNLFLGCEYNLVDQFLQDRKRPGTALCHPDSVRNRWLCRDPHGGSRRNRFGHQSWIVVPPPATCS